MKRWILVVMMLAVLYAQPGLAGDVADRTGPAVDAAKAWLADIDKKDYGRSWDEAAGLFRQAVSRQEWRRMLSGVRESLGAVATREFRSATYSTSLPGVPDGEYVVIEFATSFDNKKEAVETVTPVRDADGSWRVAGYYIN